MSPQTRLTLALLAAELIAAPAARAQYWLGPTWDVLEVEVPADVIPPGPADAEAYFGSAEGARIPPWRSHRIRFQMPKGPTKLAFWPSRRTTGDRIRIRVWNDSGSTWETEATVGSVEGRKKLFLGSAEQLAELSRAVHQALPEGAESLLEGFQLSTLDLRSNSICRTLGANYMVLVAATRPGDGERLRLCAARGARILAVGPDESAPQGLKLGHGSLWGGGRYGWARALDTSAAVALRELAEPLPRPSGEEGRFSSFLIPGVTSSEQRMLLHPSPLERSTEAAVVPAQAEDLLVPWFLGAYVVALIGVGLYGVSRPRRAVKLWIAFPVTAALASAALVIGSAATNLRPAHLDVDRMEVVAPTGEGLAQISLDLWAAASGTFEVSLPWDDGDLESILRGLGLGSPFGATERSPTILEDRLAKVLTLAGIQLNRRSDASSELTEPVSVKVPLPVRGSGGWEISNPTGAKLRQVILVVGGQRAAAAQIEPGERRAVSLGDTRQGDPGPSWVKAINRWAPEKRLPAGAFLLAAEFDAPPTLMVRPAVSVGGRRVTVVFGPLPDLAPGPFPEARP